MLDCSQNWAGTRCLGKDIEAVGRSWGKELQAKNTGMVLARIFVLYLNFLTLERDSRSLKHYSNLTISVTIFPERSCAGQLVTDKSKL